MKIFLTGATGYIGGSLGRKLVEDGHHVRGLTRSTNHDDDLLSLGVEPVHGDLNDSDLLVAEATNAEATINAADSDHAPSVETLLSALANTGKPFIHTSGSSIVGDAGSGSRSNDVYTETIMSPDSPWEPTAEKLPRVQIDRTVLAAAKQGVRTIVLCNSLIYGTGRGIKPDSVQLPRLIALAQREGQGVYIGAGENIWSNVHINDVCNLYVQALTQGTPGTFHFVENGEASFRDMSEAISARLEQQAPRSVPVEDAINEWGREVAIYALGSNSRVRSTAKEALGWNPTGPSVREWIETGQLER